ncbi:hypothetical protein [Saccharomonospora saliphila]|uniref:hypothetical protein n=1 Tax=Saccharomonospora saliphila TaxID=369829 RepID=UPI0012F86625|nr:hypothetical protein [Saccharomonospora saliphila]
MAGRRGSGSGDRSRPSAPPTAWWRLRRVWVAAGSVLAAAGAVAGVLSWIEARRANEAALGSDLRVAEYRVTTKSDVTQTSTSAVTEEETVREVDAAAVDIVLENRGEQPALINEIEVVVRAQDALTGCSGAGPLHVTTDYDIRIPPELRSRSVREPVLFNLGGRSRERILISLGSSASEAYAGWGTIFTVDLRLKRDSEIVATIPNLVLMQPWQRDDTIARMVSETLGDHTPGYTDCVAAHMRTLKRAIDRPGTHSPHMVELYDRLRAAGAGGTVEGIWTTELETVPDPDGAIGLDTVHDGVQRLEETLDTTVLFRFTETAVVYYHPGPFDGPDQARAWCREHGLAVPSLCRPRYVPAEG